MGILREDHLSLTKRTTNTLAAKAECSQLSATCQVSKFLSDTCGKYFGSLKGDIVICNVIMFAKP